MPIPKTEHIQILLVGLQVDALKKRWVQ